MYSMTDVEPISPASGYIGGKRNLVRRIVPLIDGTPHERYAEPFVGMGGIFLKRRRRPRAEYRRALDLRGLHHARVRYDLDDRGGQEHQSGRATDQ
jgi:hypothetical protein